MSFYKIRPRSGTKLQWETANTVLAEREIGYELPDGGIGTGLVKMKMGNGVTPWNDLPYAVSPQGEVVDNLESDRADLPLSARMGSELNKKSVTYNEEDDTLYINGVAWKSGIFYNNALVPLLTGYNGSNGHVVYSGIHPQDTTRYPWYAFDRNDNTYGLVAVASEEYIGYVFNNKVYVNKVELIQYNVSSQNSTFTRKIQYYDGVNWLDVKGTEGVHTLAGATTTDKITYEFTSVECYGIRVFTNNGVSHAMRTIQIYGREAT